LPPGLGDPLGQLTGRQTPSPDPGETQFVSDRIHQLSPQTFPTRDSLRKALHSPPRGSHQFTISQAQRLRLLLNRAQQLCMLFRQLVQQAHEVSAPALCPTVFR